MREILFVVLLYFGLSPSANAFVHFGVYVKQEFLPAQGEIFNIPVITERNAKLKIKIFTVDGEVIRTLKSKNILNAGSHNIVWDGKDERGQIVPDESYVPVIYAKSNRFEFINDPRENSGGEVLGNIKLVQNNSQGFSYQLPFAARVSVRAGIKAGPLLKVISDWKPHSAGRNILYWDGYDEDDIIHLAETGKQKIAIAAFKLAKNSIITSGNKKLSYLEYYKKMGWTLKSVNLANVPLQRDTKRISMQYYIPHVMKASPQVKMELLGDIKKSDSGNPIIGEQVSIRVDMNTESKWSMQESRYEIGFFVDNKFISEEEQGYVPLTWRWKPNNLNPGVHTLTVNVSGFRGQVGVKSLKFEIPEPN